MGIPSKSDFEDVEKLILKRRKEGGRIADPYFYLNLRQDYRPKKIINEITMEACNFFVGCLYDDWAEYRKQIESLRAYKWLRADPSCKFALKDVFGTYSPEWPTKDEYVSYLSAKLFSSAATVTKVQYYIMTQYQHGWLEWETDRLRTLSYTQDELEQELRDTNHRWQSLDEMNSEEARLVKLNNRAAEIHESFFNEYTLRGGNFYIHLLSLIGDYFYNSESLINHEEMVHGEEYETIDQDELNRLNKGVQLIDDILPFLQSEIDYEGEGVLVERYKKIIDWLNILKTESIEKTYSDLCVDYRGFKPVIKRKDKDDKAKKRALAFQLWKAIKRTSGSHTVSALLNILNIEGISSPHERTVQRWLAEWEQDWSNQF